MYTFQRKVCADLERLFFLLSYEMRFMLTSFIFPHLWTDFKALHNRTWMRRHLDVHYLHGGHFNIKYIFIKELKG